MKKNILSLAALLIASATVFTACSSDDSIINEPQPAQGTKTYTMTIKASKGDDATTRGLTLGRNDADTKNVLNATWDENEVVLVYQNGSQIGTLYSVASATNETTLTGELSTPNAGQDLTLYFHTNATPSYAGQDGTLATIASTYDFCAPATITEGSFTVSGSTVSTTSSASFGANQQAIVKFTLKDKGNGDAAISATKLVINDGTTDYTITPASATSEIYAAIPGFTSKTVKLTATVGNKTYTYAKASQSFTNGQYYEITVKMTEKPDLLSGVFSVSSTKKVKFSKGNLRYASGTWSFFDFQDDYYTSYSADAWDHFGWSTSATTYGMNTSQISEDYSGDFVDWGATIGTGWRTLSSAEWEWMLGPWPSPTPGTNCRTSSTIGGVANARWVKAVVHSTKGLIIYPDALTWNEATMGTAPTTSNAANDDFTYNTLTDAQWSALEAAGCVFLPAAGRRNQESVNSAGSSGHYWSSSSPEDTSMAYYMNFYSDNLYPTNCYYRSSGYSVRLVRQVE